MNLNEPPSLLRNDVKQKQNWIKVKLEGVKSNRSAIGSRVLAHYGARHKHRPCSASPVLFLQRFAFTLWLGRISSVDLDVYWPNGLHEQYKRLDANQLVTLREGSGIVRNQGWSRG